MPKHAKGKHAASRAELKDRSRREKLKAKQSSNQDAASADPASIDGDAAASQGDAIVSGDPVSEDARTSAEGKPAEAEQSSTDDRFPAHPEEGEGKSASSEPLQGDAPDQLSEEAGFPPAKRKVARRIGIACGAIFGAVAAVYLGGVLLFATHFLPQTTISTVDISLDSPDSAAEKLDAKIGDYSIKLRGQGLNLSITAAQANMALDSSAAADSILKAQNPWTWPVEVFNAHDVTASVAEAMSASGLSEVIANAVAQVNEKAEAPVDAAVVFKEDVGKFYIAPEAEGTMLDQEKVLERALEGVMNLERDIVVKKDSRLDPKITSTDQRLADACTKANQLARADITFTLDGNPAANVNATTIGQWVSVTPEFEVLFNNDELAMWAEGIGEQFNTIGSERIYTRPDGKEVTVKGGSYGWKVDSEALEAVAIEAVQNGTIGAVEIPILQSGHGFTAVGAQDWGLRYVDVDLSEQYARFYDDAGTLVWESDIVSGARGSRDSPTGVYSLNQKQSPTVLIGEMTSDGTPEYESKVTYWMPFKGNSVGLHDATWQSSFGGQRYAQGFGSHGCINLPLSAAEALYGLIESGDVVVVHY